MRRGAEVKSRGSGDKLLAVLSCLLFFSPVHFFPIQPEENLLDLKDKEGKGKRRT